MNTYLYTAGALAACLLTSACLQNVMPDTKPQLGGAKDTVGDQSAATLTKCTTPLGTAALVEQEDSSILINAGLSSPVPLLRLMMSRSGCFQVVDRGQASELMRKERALLKEGELQKDTALAAGQMVAADYLITPHVIFQDEDAGGGGIGAIIGAVLPGVLGAVAGGISVENLEAQTVLTLTNVRTGIQEAVAEGSASKKDMAFAVGALGIGSGVGAGGAGGAYASTDIGKIVSAAFLDAHNKLVAARTQQGVAQ